MLEKCSVKSSSCTTYLSEFFSLSIPSISTFHVYYPIYSLIFRSPLRKDTKSSSHNPLVLTARYLSFTNQRAPSIASPYHPGSSPCGRLSVYPQRSRNRYRLCASCPQRNEWSCIPCRRCPSRTRGVGGSRSYPNLWGRRRKIFGLLLSSFGRSNVRERERERERGRLGISGRG